MGGYGKMPSHSGVQMELPGVYEWRCLRPAVHCSYVTVGVRMDLGTCLTAVHVENCRAMC